MWLDSWAAPAALPVRLGAEGARAGWRDRGIRELPVVFWKEALRASFGNLQGEGEESHMEEGGNKRGGLG